MTDHDELRPELFIADWIPDEGCTHSVTIEEWRKGATARFDNGYILAFHYGPHHYCSWYNPGALEPEEYYRIGWDKDSTTRTVEVALWKKDKRFRIGRRWIKLDALDDIAPDVPVSKLPGIIKSVAAGDMPTTLNLCNWRYSDDGE